MLLDHYVSAMDSWKGRIDSETDYDAFRWHQWVQPLDLNDGGAPFDGALGFAFVGFCSDKGVARNKGRTGTALAPDFVRGQMSGLPCTFSQEVKLYDAGDIICAVYFLGMSDEALYGLVCSLLDTLADNHGVSAGGDILHALADECLREQGSCCRLRHRLSL